MLSSLDLDIVIQLLALRSDFVDGVIPGLAPGSLNVMGGLLSSI